MKNQITYNVDGVDYIVNIYPKQMKSIRYRFFDGKFKVTCPYLTSEKRIREGLDKFARKLIARAESQVLYTDKFIYIFGNRADLTLPNGSIDFTNYPSIEYESKEELDKKLKKMFKGYMVERVRYYEQLMGINEPYNVRIREMKTRWGTNSLKTHTLTFAMMLVHYDPEIIDTVIVHELAHYFYFDHSQNFYNIVYKYCPNYKEIQKKLKKGIRND